MARPRQLGLADKVPARLRRTAAVLVMVLGLLRTKLHVRKPELPGGPANFREKRLVS